MFLEAGPFLGDEFFGEEHLHPQPQTFLSPHLPEVPEEEAGEGSLRGRRTASPAAARTTQDEGCYPIRVGEGEFLSDEAPHGCPENMRLLGAGGVEDCDAVFGHERDGIFGVGFVASTCSPVVEDYYAVGLG